MNGMLATYESTLLESYGDGRRNQMASMKPDDDQYLIFDAVENRDTRNELEGLPAKMQNPFTNMRKWLKFELLDLRAILQAIDKKNEMNRRREETIRKRDLDRNELQNMRDGKESFRTFFMGKDSKISRITGLTNRIIEGEKDIECLILLHKIVVLQLNQAAIQFFKRDKFTTYNHTVNLYMAKQSENNAMKMEVYRKINL